MKYLLFFTFLFCMGFYCPIQVQAQNELPINTNRYALQFDGIDDVVEMSDHYAYENLEHLTVEFWAKNYNVRKMATLVDYIDSSNTRGTWAFRAYKRDVRWFIGNEGNYHGRERIAPKQNVWQHYAFIYNGTQQTFQFYLDGNLIIERPAPAPIKGAATLLRIGNDIPGMGSFAFHGLIDELRLWNKALSQTDVQQLMYGTAHYQEDHLIAYWSFDEGFGTTAGDQSTYQNHGQIYGANWHTDTPFQERQVIGLSGNWLSVYPNPVSTEARFLINPTDQLPDYIELVDINGKLIQSLPVNSTYFTYDLSQLSSGTYFFKAKGNSRYKAVSVIVE